MKDRVWLFGSFEKAHAKALKKATRCLQRAIIRDIEARYYPLKRWYDIDGALIIPDCLTGGLDNAFKDLVELLNKKADSVDVAKEHKPAKKKRGRPKGSKTKKKVCVTCKRK